MKTTSFVSAARPSTALAVACALACAALAACFPQGGRARSAPVDLTSARADVVRRLVQKHGETQRVRAERGAAQVASLWRAEDGDAAAYGKLLLEHFVAKPAELDALFDRLQRTFEQLDGVFNEAGRELRRFAEVDVGPLLPVDGLMAALDPGAHLQDDLFKSKLAFVVLANFPLSSLAERITQGPTWTRRAYAEARLALRFARRVPADVQQKIAAVTAEGDAYVAAYNLHVHHLLSEDGKRIFPAKKRLISHWNLRDEIKARYADKNGLPHQRALAAAMSRIVTQEIPLAAVNKSNVDWNPFTNTVVAAPADTIDSPSDKALGGPPSPEREPDTRYARILDCFHAARAADPFTPTTPSLIARRFEVEREIPETRFVQILEEVMKSPLLVRIGALIEKRLGRPLQPFDIWYDGFLQRAAQGEDKLDALTRARYPTAAAFQADMPNVLEKLGFTPERAKYLAERIVVDPSRGAGHALQALRREDKPRLRTRVEAGGMNYKGYNIAIHELGHNVEQVFSLFDVDYTLLAGVPNTAFTEALAFVFQSRDLEVLGQGKRTVESERQRTLSELWATYEIAGAGMVDLRMWRWMYAHPKATPAELRAAVVQLAKDVWNEYYAPIFKVRDVVLLGIYSHMISNFLYLPDYALGHLIAFQLEDHVSRAGALGPEFERMAKAGLVTPDLWMKKATGKPISPSILLDAAKAALDAMGAP